MRSELHGRRIVVWDGEPTVAGTGGLLRDCWSIFTPWVILKKTLAQEERKKREGKSQRLLRRLRPQNQREVVYTRPNYKTKNVG